MGRPGVFVTGTDTGVGKTVVSACLVRRFGAEYWKPAQTGLASEAADSDTVRALSGVDAVKILPPRYNFAAPLSPEDAGRMEGVTPVLADFELPAGGPIVVEGAGGVMVPLGPGAFMVDLMARFGLPIVLVARSTLGTINHTLLSLRALREHGLRVAGVVLVGPPSAGNAAAITRHGAARILAELPPMEITHGAIAAACTLFPTLETCLDMAGGG